MHHVHWQTSLGTSLFRAHCPLRTMCNFLRASQLYQRIARARMVASGRVLSLRLHKRLPPPTKAKIKQTNTKRQHLLCPAFSAIFPAFSIVEPGNGLLRTAEIYCICNRKARNGMHFDVEPKQKNFHRAQHACQSSLMSGAIEPSDGNEACAVQQGSA